MKPNHALSTCLLGLFAASFLIVASALGILVWVFGVRALLLLAGALLLFVILSVARDVLAQARQASVSPDKLSHTRQSK